MAKFVNFGQLLLKKDKSAFYIKLDEKMDITINGQKYDGILTVKSPVQVLQASLDKGKITEEEFDEKSARYADDGDLSFVRQYLTAVFDD